MFGSLDEAQAVLADRGAVDTKTVRLRAYRYAARARREQQLDTAGFDATRAGRREQQRWWSPAAARDHPGPQAQKRAPALYRRLA